MEWLDRVTSDWLTLEEIVKLFSKVVGPFFYSHQQQMRVSIVPHPVSICCWQSFKGLFAFVRFSR